MISRQVSVGTLRALAISRESASTSESPSWRKISPARSSPMATSSTAAFCRPVSDESRVASSDATSVLGHPLLDLRGDPLGLALHQLVERLEVRVGGARRQRDRRRPVEDLRALLELGEPDGLLDLGQPRRAGERLALALAQRAGHEEQEDQRGEPEADPLERAE